MKNSAKILLFLTTLFSLKVSGQDLSGLIPGAADLPGWEIISAPKIYNGDGLYDYIDGGADIYYEYGFMEVITVNYSDPSQNNIHVEVYEMTDASSAYGIFSITQQVADWKDQYGNISSVTDNYISFWEGKYYVNISWSTRQHLDQPHLDKLAGLISERIPDKGQLPELVYTFSKENLDRKVVFIKGNLALSNYYYFDYKDVFGIRSAIAWPEEKYHRIIMKYETVQGSADAIGSARISFLNNKRFSDVAVAFQGFSCRDNKGNNILVRQVENYIIVLVGLDPGLSMVPVMDDITLDVENLGN